jgi:hypothetical protein
VKGQHSADVAGTGVWSARGWGILFAAEVNGIMGRSKLVIFILRKIKCFVVILVVLKKEL